MYILFIDLQISYLMAEPSSDMKAFHDLVKKCKNLVILTGAGVSAESGVPTFRGAGGLWRRWNATVRQFSVMSCGAIAVFTLGLIVDEILQCNQLFFFRYFLFFFLCRCVNTYKSSLVYLIYYGKAVTVFYLLQDLATPEAFHANKSLVWEFYHYRREVMLSKKPNAVSTKYNYFHIFAVGLHFCLCITL